MNAIIFSKRVFKLYAKHMIIEERSLEDAVRDSAEETTSPRGVEPKLHIVERDNEYRLMMWGSHGNGESYISSHETREEAELRWLEITYQYDFLNSEEGNLWFDTPEEAIQDYVDMKCEDGITYESVKKQIDDYAAEIEEDKKRIANNMEADINKAYDFCNANNRATNNAVKLARKILYSGYNPDGILGLYVRYSDIVSESAKNKAQDIINMSK